MDRRGDLELNVKYQCDTCGEVFDGENANLFLEHHVKSHTTKILICDDCGEIFKLASLLHEHRNNIHNYGNQRIVISNVTTVDELKQSQFTKNEVHLNEEVHVKDEMNDEIHVKDDQHFQKEKIKEFQSKEVECKYCLKKFCRKGSLRYHLLAIHKIGSGLQCKQCEKIFAESHKLKRHIAEVHERVKKENYHCNKCEKVLETQSGFRRHKIIHKGIYKCEKCKISFSDKNSLEKHCSKANHQIQL